MSSRRLPSKIQNSSLLGCGPTSPIWSVETWPMSLCTLPCILVIEYNVYFVCHNALFCVHYLHRLVTLFSGNPFSRNPLNMFSNWGIATRRGHAQYKLFTMMVGALVTNEMCLIGNSSVWITTKARMLLFPNSKLQCFAHPLKPRPTYIYIYIYKHIYIYIYTKVHVLPIFVKDFLAQALVARARAGRGAPRNRLDYMYYV